MVSALSLIAIAFVAGLVVARLESLPPDAAETLNRFVIQICVPAAVLVLVPRLRISAELAILVVTPWLLAGITIPLVSGLARLLGLDEGSRNALFLAVALGNTSFVGYPLIEALLGESEVSLAVVYDQLGSFVLLSTFGLLVVARYSGGESPSVEAMAMRVLRFPPFVALCLALLFKAFPSMHPVFLDPALERIGAALVPIAMFAVGLRTRIGWPRERGALILGLTLKMVVFPALALGLARAVGADERIVRVSVLESAMPPMITACALAASAGFAPELAAALAAYGIVAGMISVPLWAALLGVT